MHRQAGEDPAAMADRTPVGSAFRARPSLSDTSRRLTVATAETRTTGKPFNPYRAFRCLFVPEALAASRELVTPVAKLVYGHLVRRAGKSGLCYPSSADISKHVGCSKRHCVRALKELEKVNLIQVQARSDKRGRTTSNCFEFLWHPIFEAAGNPQPSSIEDDKMSPSQGDVDVTLPMTRMSPSGVTRMSPSSMKRNIGRKSSKEEERWRADRHPVPQPTPPPPPGINSQVSGDEERVAKSFIADHIDDFLSQYPDAGSKARAITEAVKAYLTEPEPRSLLEWWNGVIDALGAYRNWARGNRERTKDACWWFADGYHKRAWPIAGMGPPATTPKSCQKCGGSGRINAKWPKAMLDDLTISEDDLTRWAEEHGTACECGPQTNEGAHEKTV